MKSKFTFLVCKVAIALMICQASFAQNSVLINFGSSGCGLVPPSFSLIKNPLTGTPGVLNTCDLSTQLPSYYNVFIAYNPKNNRVYVCDLSTGQTRIWVLDIGLPANISCPISIPAIPDYTYNYISNNFEFDNNGDLWSLSEYDPFTGQCNIDKFDVTTGTVINSRILQFPVGQFPTTIESGDVTILPNGRMFAVLGSGLCQLYEITNYNTTANASATYLQTMPKDCYGIAYLNGILELTGNDFGFDCFYYDYNIASNTLGTEKTFQSGQLPIDNSSFTPSVGCTKRLVSATLVNSNTADLVYEVYQANLGNTVIRNVNLTDNLAAVFGTLNVSNVSASFVPGANAANLTLNPDFNGITDINVLNGGQSLPNNVFTNQDYFFKVLIRCRATNLNTSLVYFNSAVASGNIGGNNPLTLISVADSSNNGASAVVDPNNNGNAGDLGENLPTPFSFGSLPVKFLAIDAWWLDKNSAFVKWEVATPTENAAFFEVEYSSNRETWLEAGTVHIDNVNRGNYDFSHLNVPPGNIYYRIRQTDNDGTHIYSNVVLLRRKEDGAGYSIYPNPANSFVSVRGITGRVKLELFDATGRKLLIKTTSLPVEDLDTRQYPTGTYFLKIADEGGTKTYKLIIRH